MEAIFEVAKVYNILEAKLKHSKVPLSLSTIMLCPDLKGAKPTQVRDCMRGLVSRNLAHRCPIFEGRDRVGFMWGAPPKAPNIPLPTPTKSVEEVRLRINPDKSVTILTSKFKVTIEVPE
jgi:hypothetical protein